MKNLKIKSFCDEFTIYPIIVYNKLKCKQIVNYALRIKKIPEPAGVCKLGEYWLYIR